MTYLAESLRSMTKRRTMRLKLPVATNCSFYYFPWKEKEGFLEKWLTLGLTRKYTHWAQSTFHTRRWGASCQKDSLPLAKGGTWSWTISHVLEPNSSSDVFKNIETSWSTLGSARELMFWKWTKGKGKCLLCLFYLMWPNDWWDVSLYWR